MEIVEDLQDAVPALAGLVELEMQVRREFQNDAAAEFALQFQPRVVELRQRGVLLLGRADDADVRARS